MYNQVVPADGVSTANGEVSINEMRDPGRPETEVDTYAILAGSDSRVAGPSISFLSDHMTRAELRDTQTPSRLLGSYSPPTLLALPRNLWFGGPYDWPVPVEDGLAGGASDE